MNKAKKGFSLIELLVSSVVGYFLITVLITALWTVYQNMAQLRAYNAAWATVSVAHDMLLRDFAGIPCERSLFKKIAEDSLIWSAGNGNDYGYELIGNSLKRTEGHYDTKQQCWHKAKHSVVLQQVKHCKFAIEGRADIIDTIKVSLVVMGGAKEIEDCTVMRIRNCQIG